MPERGERAQVTGTLRFARRPRLSNFRASRLTGAPSRSVTVTEGARRASSTACVRVKWPSGVRTAARALFPRTAPVHSATSRYRRCTGRTGNPCVAQARARVPETRSACALVRAGAREGSVNGGTTHRERPLWGAAHRAPRHKCPAQLVRARSKRYHDVKQAPASPTRSALARHGRASRLSVRALERERRT